MRPGALRSLICTYLAAALTVGGCRPPGPPTPARPAAPAASIDRAAPAAPAPAGRPQIPLSPDPAGALTLDQPEPARAAAGPAAPPLPDAEADRLLARLPPLPPDVGPATGPAAAPVMRPPSAPPPRADAVQPIAFVIPTGRPVADAPLAPPAPSPAPLPPPEISPQGEVAAESEIRIRFSEPMVPVAQVGLVAAPPATVSPAVAGAWRWIDTRVLQLTSPTRFPGSTELTVTVPAGVRAVSGAELAAPARATFATAPVRITGVYPTTPIRPDSPIAVSFDQRVDPARLAGLLAVLGPRGAPLPARAISLAEAEPLWRRNPSLEYEAARIAARLGPHVVVLAPQAAWPAGISGRVVLPRGAPSLEGPRQSARESVAAFTVAAPFTVRGVACGPDDEPRARDLRCPAGGWATLELSNAILPASFRAELLQLAGDPLEDHAPSGASIGFLVPSTPGRASAVGLGEGLRDVYDQPLTGPRRIAFAIGPAETAPALDASEGLEVLDPRFQIPQWVVTAEAVPAVRVELYQAQPADYFAFTAFERGERSAPPVRRALDRQHTVGARYGARVRVDLRPALGAAGTGHVICVATAVATGPRPGQLTRLRRVAWIQVTRLGVSARGDRERIRAWVRDVSPASFLAPRAGAAVGLLVAPPAAGPGPARTAAIAATDADGQVTLELPPPAAAPAPAGDAPEPAVLLVARDGDDSTFEALEGPAERAARHQTASWYATDDRFTYRPGETVHVKGWVRWSHDGVNPDLALPAAGEAVAYALTDARGNQLAAGSAPLSDHGGFDLDAALPPNANLGPATFHLQTRGAAHALTISIQEFRTPAFSVTLADDVTHAGALPLVAGERIEMSAAARYYAGGGLPGARVEWTARLEGAAYAPPGWDGFTFAPVHPREEDSYWGYRAARDPAPIVVERAGALSGASAAAIALGVGAVPGGRPATLTVDAVVTDVDRARIRATSRAIVVHPSSYYVGLRLRPGDPRVVEAIATDIDGAAVPGVAIDVAIEAVLGSERYRSDARVLETQRCALTSAAAPVACPLRRDPARAYTAIARIADARGRASAAYLPLPWWAPDAQRSLAIIPDRAEYRPGDVARLELRSDVAPATAIVSFARQGVIAQRRVELAGPSTVIELPIEPAYLQNVHVVVDRLGRRPLAPQPAAPAPQPAAPAPTAPAQPRSAPAPAGPAPAQPLPLPGPGAAPAPGAFPPPPPPSGPQLQASTPPSPRLLPLPGEDSAEIDLPVQLESARLAMRARPTRPLVEPGAPATFEVEVRRGGEPVAGAEVALIVVDEAVLAVSQRTHADPLAPFYRNLDAGTWKTSTFDRIADAGDDLDGAPGVTRYDLDSIGRIGHGFGTGSGYGAGYGGLGGAAGLAGGATTVQVRKDLRPDAAFSPRLVTGPDGKVALTVTMPESLTRFRVIALASAGTYHFGKAEGTIVTQRKLSARALAPRFLTQGDAFSLPVVVQNLGAAPRTVDVAARAANLVAIGPRARRVTIPGGQRAEVRFDFQARARGRATIQTIVIPAAGPAAGAAPAADAAGAADASSVEVPIYAPATTEAFATYGTVDGAPRVERLAVPADVFPEVGGVEVELASTQLQSLTDAYWYLYGYPYECAEQRSSRMLATAALGPLLDAFAAPGRPTRAEIDATIARDVQILTQHQLPDGGWGYFQDLAADPFVSLQVLAALAAHRVTAPVTRRAAAYAERAAGGLLAELARAAAAPAARRLDAGPLAYRIDLAATALAVYPIDARARLLAVVARAPRAAAMRARLLTALLAATHETAAAATVAERHAEDERLLLASDTRTTALVLGALLAEAPDHALVTKLVRGLLDARRGGRWRSTQENVTALAALRRYFDVHERATPAFTAQVWLGGAAYAEQAFAGRSAARGLARATWAQLVPGATHDLAIARSGEGRLYYRVGITYAPRSADLPALDAGFVVRRAYTPIDDPRDVTRDAAGRVHVRLGARVQVTLEALATTDRHAVALVDPLPAGLEAVNTALATSERAAAASTPAGAAAWDHVAMRDDRSEAFAMHMPAGRRVFSYTARATTPGTFLAAPARAEEMYSPETFGRSTGATVIIE